MDDMADYRIDTPAARAKLAPRRKPYFHKILTNRFVCFRYMTPGTPGTWGAKRQEGRKEIALPLGTLDHLAEKDRFAFALKVAQKWFDEQDTLTKGQTIIPSKMTLRQAIQAYIVEQGKKTKNGLEAARSTRSRFNLLVVPYADANGRRWIDTPIARITTAEFAAWREWVVKLPVTRTGEIAGKPRKASTVNRDVASFRAALNLAAKVHRLHDHWTEVLKRDLVGDEGRGSEVYLKPEQRARLLASAAEVAPHLLPLAKAMLIVPIRPGALAALTVADYDRRKHSLWVHTDKVNAGRWVALPAKNKDGTPHESVALVAGLIRDKLPGAPLFANEKGGHWQAWAWNDAIKEVAAAAKLPAALTIYWLRHSRITDLITAASRP